MVGNGKLCKCLYSIFSSWFYDKILIEIRNDIGNANTELGVLAVELMVNWLFFFCFKTYNKLY